MSGSTGKSGTGQLGGEADGPGTAECE